MQRIGADRRFPREKGSEMQAAEERDAEVPEVRESSRDGWLRALGLGLAVALLLAATAGGAAAQGEAPDPLYDDLFDEEFVAPPTGYPDPMETANRGVFAFNRQVDRWILDPVTRAYRFVVPKPARNAIARFFLNLGSTKTIVNDFLQLEWRDAGVSTTRLVVNSTLGLAGLFDVAEKMGLARHESDFGQTLALAGTPSGPYLVLPVLGPANVRDGVGVVVDGFFQPTYYILGPADLIIGPTEVLLYSGSSGISAREQRFTELKALEESSIDFYAALRSGYFQDRIDAIWGRREGHRTSQEPFLSRRAEEAEREVDADPLFGGEE
jgi:phospholipid-binding lipoprotein MlaA